LDIVASTQPLIVCVEYPIQRAARVHSKWFSWAAILQEPFQRREINAPEKKDPDLSNYDIFSK